MDRTSIREPYRRSNKSLSPRSQGYSRQSLQLPTPEASRSGLDPYDDDYQEESSNGRSQVRERELQRPTQYTLYASHANSNRLSSRRDSCNQYRPESPPYIGGDSEPISLPPLKTMLAGGISSPPATPTAYSRSFQPTPREPAFTSSTYKPPALYPHKKPRTDVPIEPMSRSSRSRSPGCFRSPVEPPVITQSNQMDSFGVQPVQLNPYLSSAPRRRSTYEVPTSPRTSQIEYQRAVEGNQTYCRYGNRPDLYREERYAQDTQRVRDGFVKPVADAQYDLVVRPSYTNRDARSPIGQADYFHSHRSPGFASGPYMAAQPALFLPGHGEYHSSKSRKRSNLPKASTDIMKHWFDENIGNPYPSEEQKAVFSNATNISMNQVSNWFINHRRRCPELRDKREKAKGRERDDR